MVELKSSVYCLDSNVLIQPWQKYYSPNLCPSYWDSLNKLGEMEIIFISEMVFDEIVKTDDDLSKWLSASKIPVKPITEEVSENLRKIYASNPKNKLLVDNKKGRSLADPWVISHAMTENAIVVTKEEKITAGDSKQIKIPNVCDNIGVPWMNDFDMIKSLNFNFFCEFEVTT